MMIINKFSLAYLICLITLILCISQRTNSLEEEDSLINSEIDNYILYFDEWRFDWDHANDFDTDYHQDWTDIINQNNNNNNDKMYGCTHNFQSINKKLCVLQTNDGDFTFKFKTSNDINNNNLNTHSNMVSSAKKLSDYYDNILLKFDDDNYWSNIESIDGINGYEAIKKCQPFTFMELCAIYNPYADNLNIHAKIANFRKKRKEKKEILSNANIDYDNIYNDDDELSIDDAISYAMQDYDDTLGYSYWRGNRLGFDKFDEHSGIQNDKKIKVNNFEKFGGHMYYFNQLSFNWDDSRDWVSFSKQTDAKSEEVGGHPDKLEEVGAHPKQVDDIDDNKSKTKKGHIPSRSYSKCTGAIPFIHKHACVTVTSHNTHVQLTAAKTEEINILYNGLNDIFNEMDNDIVDNYVQNHNQQENEGNNKKVDGDNALIDIQNDMDDEYEYEYGYTGRRLQSYESISDTDMDEEIFVFDNDMDWDEVITSYGFDNANENNFGRFGSKRIQNKDIKISSAIQNMFQNMNVHSLRPKLLSKTLPFLFPAIKKCVNAKIIKLCLVLDIHQKAIKLDIHLPRVGPLLQCIKNAKHCAKPKLKKIFISGKRIFNSVKRGMGLIRQIGRRNRYNKKRKHLKKALKQIRKIRKNLKHLTRQIQKSIRASAANDIDENRYEDGDDDTMAQKVFDSDDERGLLLYASVGTNDFNDIWDDDNEWNAIEDMKTWEGTSIRRKCLTLWKKRLCLCQFLGWLDGPEKYHCLFPHHERFDDFNGYETNTENYQNVQVKNVNPKIIVHHFHHIYGAKQIETNLQSIDDENDDILPHDQPNWTPLWMWQDIQNQHQNQQIAKVLYSAQNTEIFNANVDENDEYERVLDEYYDDITNLNEMYDEYDGEEQELDEQDEDLKEDAWIEMSESATHSFDTEWEDDEHWDEIMEMKTWEGTSIRRKCLHLWKHRLCLCQFLGWMDTNKYQCIYHKRSWHPLQQQYNHVEGHIYDDKMSPNIIFHDANHAAGPIIHHFVGAPDTAQYAIHHFHHYGPYIGRTRRRKRKIINIEPRQIQWHVHNPVVVHHFFHHVQPELGPGPEREREIQPGHGLADKLRRKWRRKKTGKKGRESTLRKREKALRARERKEKQKEKKFKNLLWKDRHAHQMWKIMKTKQPVIGKTATGRHMIVAQHINPHGEPIMVSMHKHMPNERPQWMPQGLFTNLKHKGYYMVHAHHRGDHSTVTKDENRFPHGSDIVRGPAAKIQQYDVYDNYYYTDYDNEEDMYDDEYYYNSEYDELFDADKIYERYNDVKYEDEWYDFMDEFVDNSGDEWVISNVLNSLESAFYDLFGGGEAEYWDNLEQIESKKGEIVGKQCMNVFDKEACVCRYMDGHYHCRKHRRGGRKYYLDVAMPKETPQWMSAHDFEWLKDQRLSAFTQLLPDPLLKHMEYNQLFNIPFNALTKLVSPAVKMEHIEWHKDNDYEREDGDMVSSAAAMQVSDNMYNYYDDEYDYYDYYDGYNEYMTGYVNEYGDYIIDEFYNELDGTKWVVTNQWTDDLNDIWHNDDMQIFSAAAVSATSTSNTQKKTDTNTNTNGKTNTKTNTNTGSSNNNVKTNAEQTLSSKCMLVFGRNVCLCEFINWVYDHSGNNPLYRCYSSGNGNDNNANMNMNNNNNNNDKVHHEKVISTLTSLQKEVANTRKAIDALINKNSPEMNEKSSTSHQGWGSKIEDYGQQEQQYNSQNDEQYTYDAYDNEYDNDNDEYDDDDAYENDNDNDNEYENEYENYEDESDESVEYGYGYDEFYDENEGIESIYGEYNGYDLNNNYDMDIEQDIEDIIKPNWWTEGEGFTQTLYIGVNTFWGLILLSLFFGMIACSLVCAFLNFKRLFCKDGKFSMNGNYNYETKYNVNKMNDYQTDGSGLDTIDEDENVKFNVNNNNNNTDSEQQEYQSE